VRVEQLPGYALLISTPTRGSGSTSSAWGIEEPVLSQSVSELRVELRKAKERLRYKKHVILGCLRQPGFEV
jgi:hypothetical protein